MRQKLKVKVPSPLPLTPRSHCQHNSLYMVSPVPNLHALRSDALIQAQVEQRLRDLVDENKSGTKIKFLIGGSVDVVASH